MPPKNFRQTTLPRFDPNEVDAVTAEPLNPHRCIRVTGPDGKFEMFYNTSTLLRIALTRRCWMQPPHFREPMSQSLLEQVMLLEGYTEDPVAAAVRAEEAEEAARRRELAAALAVDPATAGHAHRPATTGDAIDAMAAAALQRQVQHAEGFNQLMDSFVTLNRHQVYVCPVCYSWALHRICVGVREPEPPADVTGDDGAAAPARSTPARSQRGEPRQSATPARQLRTHQGPSGAGHSTPRAAAHGASALIDDDDDVPLPSAVRAAAAAAAATPNRSALIDDDDDDAPRSSVPAALRPAAADGAPVAARRQPRYVRPYSARPLITEEEFRDLMRAGGSMPEANALLHMGIDPIDVIRSLDEHLELPYVVFYDAIMWKQHLRRHHGELDEDEGARNDHSLRAKINEFVSALNHKEMRRRNFMRVQDTTQEYWKNDARYNVSRYNAIVRELQAVTARPGGKREVLEHLAFAAVAPDWGQGTDAAGHKLTEKEEADFFVSDDSSGSASESSAVTRARKRDKNSAPATARGRRRPRGDENTEVEGEVIQHRGNSREDAAAAAPLASQVSETASERKARRRAERMAEMAEQAKVERAERRRIAQSMGYGRTRGSDEEESEEAQEEGEEGGELNEEEDEEFAWSSEEEEDNGTASPSQLDDQDETAILLGSASPEPPVSTGPQLSLFDDDDANTAAVVAAVQAQSVPRVAAVRPSLPAADGMTQLVDSPLSTPTTTAPPTLNLSSERSHVAGPVHPVSPLASSSSAVVAPQFYGLQPRSSITGLTAANSTITLPTQTPGAVPASDVKKSARPSSSSSDSTSSASSNTSDSDSTNSSSSGSESSSGSGSSGDSISDSEGNDDDDVLVTELRNSMAQNSGAPRQRGNTSHRSTIGATDGIERPSRPRYQVQTTMAEFLPRARSGAERIAMSAEASERLLRAEEQRAAAAASSAAAARGLAPRSISSWMAGIGGMAGSFSGSNSRAPTPPRPPVAHPSSTATVNRVASRSPFTSPPGVLLSNSGPAGAASLAAGGTHMRGPYVMSVGGGGGAPPPPAATPLAARTPMAGAGAPDRSPTALAAALRTAAHTAASGVTVISSPSPPKEDILVERARQMWGAATAAWGAVRTPAAGAGRPVVPTNTHARAVPPPPSSAVNVPVGAAAAQPVRLAAGTQNLIAAVYSVAPPARHVPPSIASPPPAPPQGASTGPSGSLLAPILGRKFPLTPGAAAVTAAPSPSTNRLVDAVLVSSPRGSAASGGDPNSPTLNEAMLAQHDRNWAPRAIGASPIARMTPALAPEGAFVSGAGGGDVAAARRLALPVRRARSTSPVDSVASSDVSVASFARDRLTGYERALLDRADKQLGHQ